MNLRETLEKDYSWVLELENANESTVDMVVDCHEILVLISKEIKEKLGKDHINFTYINSGLKPTKVKELLHRKLKNSKNKFLLIRKLAELFDEVENAILSYLYDFKLEGFSDSLTKLITLKRQVKSILKNNFNS